MYRSIRFFIYVWIVRDGGIQSELIPSVYQWNVKLNDNGIFFTSADYIV